MGGGDLNTKKAWHPSTLKNQERVWKAEQAAAEEQKRILELQRERAQERDREELNKQARQNSNSIAGGSDNRLSWMYDQKPDKKVQQEDYLLGKAIDKNYENAGKTLQNEIPAVSRRVVGSSMIAAGGDTQVDLARKLKEDPLLLVKERERAARAALLNNPVQRKKLTELLRKEQDQKNKKKSEKKSKKKDLDNLLAAKINALGGENGMNIAKLLESSDDSSSDSSSEEEKPKKKKKSKSKKRKHKRDTDSKVSSKRKKSKESKSTRRHDDSDTETELYKSKTSKHNNYKKTESLKLKPSRDERSDSDDHKHAFQKNRDDKLYYNRRSGRDYRESSPNMKEIQQQFYESSHNRRERQQQRDSSIDRTNERRKTSLEVRKNDKHGYRSESKRAGLSEEEKNARLAAMAAAGAEREIQRGQRVAAQLAEKAAPEKSLPRHSSRNEARSLPDSLESRIHSNRHYIQRDKQHMNEHFARR